MVHDFVFPHKLSSFSFSTIFFQLISLLCVVSLKESYTLVYSNQYSILLRLYAMASQGQRELWYCLFVLHASDSVAVGMFDEITFVMYCTTRRLLACLVELIFFVGPTQSVSLLAATNNVGWRLYQTCGQLRLSYPRASSCSEHDLSRLQTALAHSQSLVNFVASTARRVFNHFV